MLPRAMTIDSRDAGKLLLRLVLGFGMLLHGIHKLGAGIDGIVGLVESKGLPGFVAYGVYLGEVVAPLLLIVGYVTRVAGLVLAFNMVVAIGLAHAGDVFAIGQHGGWKVELQMLYLVGGLSIALLGGGRYGLSRGHGRFD
jgi:putative oxidoreductase